MPPPPAIAPKQPTRAGWALLLTSVAFFMVTLDSLVVVTALPAIHRELGGQVSTLEWAVNAYLLVFAAGIITAASIGERARLAGGLRPGPPLLLPSPARRPPPPPPTPPP